MDTNSPNQSVNKNTRLLIILFIAIAVVLLFSVLIYFKVIQVQNLVPGKKNEPMPTSTTATNTTASSSIKIHCPTIKAVCDKGYSLFKDQKLIGLGYKLVSGNPIYAAFDGTLTVITSDSFGENNRKNQQETFITAYIDNTELNRRAQYYLKGSINKDGFVQKGEQIGKVNANQISIYDNSSLVFSLFLSNSTTPIIINDDVFE